MSHNTVDNAQEFRKFQTENTTDPASIEGYIMYNYMIEEDLNILMGPKTDRMIRFDEYRLGDCVEECDRMQFKRRFARARYVVA